MMEVLEVLERARGRLEDPSMWCKGSYTAGIRQLGKDECQVCLIGALRWGVSGDPTMVDHTTASMSWGEREKLRLFNRAYAEMRNEVIATYGYLGSLYGFNDAEPTTHEEILGLFDGAIERLQPEPLAAVDDGL